MRLFKCQCDWTYVIGNRRVFGAIWENGDATHAHMMSVEQWEDNYADCAESYYSVTPKPHKCAVITHPDNWQGHCQIKKNK